MPKSFFLKNILFAFFEIQAFFLLTKLTKMPTKWLQNGNFVNVKNACPLPLQNFNFKQKKVCSHTFLLNFKNSA